MTRTTTDVEIPFVEGLVFISLLYLGLSSSSFICSNSSLVSSPFANLSLRISWALYQYWYPPRPPDQYQRRRKNAPKIKRESRSIRKTSESTMGSMGFRFRSFVQSEGTKRQAGPLRRRGVPQQLCFELEYCLKFLCAAFWLPLGSTGNLVERLFRRVFDPSLHERSGKDGNS